MRIDDDDIRELFNGARDGTATDAVRRYHCQIALGECCVGDDGIPGGLRYPTRTERLFALQWVADTIVDRERRR